MFCELFHRHRVAQVVVLTLHLGADPIAGLSLQRHRRTAQRAGDFKQGRLRTLSEAAYRAFHARYNTMKAVREGLTDTLTVPGAGLTSAMRRAWAIRSPSANG